MFGTINMYNYWLCVFMMCIHNVYSMWRSAIESSLSRLSSYLLTLSVGNHKALWDALPFAAHTPTHQPTTDPRAKQQLINGVYVEQLYNRGSCGQFYLRLLPSWEKSISALNMNSSMKSRAQLDDTVPMKCTIESSYSVKDHTVRFYTYMHVMWALLAFLIS